MYRWWGIALFILALLMAACSKAGPQVLPPDQKAAAPIPAPVPAPGGGEAAQLPPRPFVGSPAPDWSGAEVHTGQPLSMADVKGNITLVNFWATWCRPCEVEMPLLQDTHRQSGGKIKIVAIGGDENESQEDLKSYAERLGLTFGIVWDGGKARDAYQVFGYPTTLVLDRHGIVRGRHNGILSRELLLQLLADAGRF